jgi:hypothetical protein
MPTPTRSLSETFKNITSLKLHAERASIGVRPNSGQKVLLAILFYRKDAQ